MGSSGTLTDRDSALVGKLYGALRGDPAVLLAALDPAVEWINRDESVDSGPHRGHAGARRIVRDLDDFYEDYRHEPQELRRDGDRVLVVVDFHARLRARRGVLWQRELHSWTIREGRVVRVEWGRIA